MFFNYRQFLESRYKSELGMVKRFKLQVKAECIARPADMVAQAQQLTEARRKLFIQDRKRAALRRKQPYVKQPITIYDRLVVSQAKSSSASTQEQRQVDAYRVTLENCQHVLDQLKQIDINTQRPDDYLVEMFKSDKQMFKVRHKLVSKQTDLKQSLQGRMWQSKTKRKQRAQKKAQSKRARKKARIQAKRPKLTKKAAPSKKKIKKTLDKKAKN